MIFDAVWLVENYLPYLEGIDIIELITNMSFVSGKYIDWILELNNAVAVAVSLFSQTSILVAMVTHQITDSGW